MPSRTLRRRRGRQDVAAYIRECGGRDNVLADCRFFGWAMGDCSPELLRGLLAEFDAELQPWADLRKLVRELEDKCHTEN
jgi:hypothetical protein